MPKHIDYLKPIAWSKIKDDGTVRSGELRVASFGNEYPSRNGLDKVATKWGCPAEKLNPVKNAFSGCFEVIKPFTREVEETEEYDD